MPCDAVGSSFIWIGQVLVAVGFGLGLGLAFIFSRWMTGDGYDWRRVQEITRERTRALRAYARRTSKTNAGQERPTGAVPAEQVNHEEEISQ